jgi:hypothetical protein
MLNLNVAEFLSILCSCGAGVLKLIFCGDIYGMFDVQGFVKSLYIKHSIDVLVLWIVFAISHAISFGVSYVRIESVTMWFIS